MSRAIVFLAGPGARAGNCIAALQKRWPEQAWVVVVREVDRGDLAAAAARGSLEVEEWRVDKPTGGKVAFVRGLRRERFDLAVVWSSGDPSYDPPALAGWLCGARSLMALDGGGLRAVGVAGIARRVVTSKVWRGAAFGLYRNSVGRLLARPILALRALRR